MLVLDFKNNLAQKLMKTNQEKSKIFFSDVTWVQTPNFFYASERHIHKLQHTEGLKKLVNLIGE